MNSPAWQTADTSLNSWKHTTYHIFCSMLLMVTCSWPTWFPVIVKRVGSFKRTPKPQRVVDVNGEREWTTCKRVIRKHALSCYVILHQVYKCPLNQPSTLTNYVNYSGEQQIQGFLENMYHVGIQHFAPCMWHSHHEYITSMRQAWITLFTASWAENGGISSLKFHIRFSI